MTNFLRLLPRIGSAAVVAVLLTECILQVMFYFGIGVSSRLALFFNPYCDQRYWEIHYSNKQFEDKDLIPHPILTFEQRLQTENVVGDPPLIGSGSALPDPNNRIIIYGSSFVGHPIFKNELNKQRQNLNYAVPSYGFDQIYMSYELTKHLHRNKTILIGFLLEDIDRSIFSFREYPKLKFSAVKASDEEVNFAYKTPASVSVPKGHPTFFSAQLATNFLDLAKTKFVPKNSTCRSSEKKKLFEFFVSEILKSSRRLGQEVIFVSFNFQEDIETGSENWREFFVSDFFSDLGDKVNATNVRYINSKDLLMAHMTKNSLPASSYFDAQDRHYNALAFSLVIKALN